MYEPISSDYERMSRINLTFYEEPLADNINVET